MTNEDLESWDLSSRKLLRSIRTEKSMHIAPVGNAIEQIRDTGQEDQKPFLGILELPKQVTSITVELPVGTALQLNCGELPADARITVLSSQGIEGTAEERKTWSFLTLDGFAGSVLWDVRECAHGVLLSASETLHSVELIGATGVYLSVQDDGIGSRFPHRLAGREPRATDFPDIRPVANTVVLRDAHCGNPWTDGYVPVLESHGESHCSMLLRDVAVANGRLHLDSVFRLESLSVAHRATVELSSNSDLVRVDGHVLIERARRIGELTTLTGLRGRLSLGRLAKQDDAVLILAKADRVALIDIAVSSRPGSPGVFSNLALARCRLSLVESPRSELQDVMFIDGSVEFGTLASASGIDFTGDCVAAVGVDSVVFATGSVRVQECAGTLAKDSSCGRGLELGPQSTGFAGGSLIDVTVDHAKAGSQPTLAALSEASRVEFDKKSLPRVPLSRRSFLKSELADPTIASAVHATARVADEKSIIASGKSSWKVRSHSIRSHTADRSERVVLRLFRLFGFGLSIGPAAISWLVALLGVTAWSAHASGLRLGASEIRWADMWEHLLGSFLLPARVVTRSPAAVIDLEGSALVGAQILATVPLIFLVSAVVYAAKGGGRG